MFMMMFQIHTFSMLAFVGSAAIVKMHSMAYSSSPLKVPTSIGARSALSQNKPGKSSGTVQYSADFGHL